MRSELNKALKAEFHRQMAERYPQFRLFDKLHYNKMAKAYGWSVAPRFALYISLWANRKTEDWFTLECCCSTKDNFPGLAGMGTIWDDPVTDLRPELLRDRILTHFIGHLMGHNKGYKWWLGPEPDYDDLQWLDDIADGKDVDYPIEKALAEIPAAVRDSLDQVGKHVMPYFRKLAQAVGVDPGLIG